MSMPSLAERVQPGLVETLAGPRDPRRCQSCSTGHSPANPLARWLEHDEWDRVPERGPRVVVLCRRCSGRLIEPHPRLYRQLANGEPFPGCMGLCLACAHRDGVHCTSPAAKVNGGEGISFEYSEAPYRAHIYCGGRSGRSGWRTFFPGRVVGCSAREERSA